MLEENYICKCGTVRDPIDILNVSGRIDVDDFLFTVTFTCSSCLEKENK